MQNLLPVAWFIIDVDQSYDGGVICKFDDSVAGVDGGTVMCEKGEKEKAEDASLQCTSVHEESGGGMVFHLHILRSLAEEVQHPGTQS